jgi:hypothetical protein
MISTNDRAEARRDALSHLTKGTNLSDEAVRRICLALTTHPDAGPDRPEHHHTTACLLHRRDPGAGCICREWSREAP